MHRRSVVLVREVARAMEEQMKRRRRAGDERAGDEHVGCAPKPDVRRWSTLGVTRYTREVLSETCFRETGKAPIRTGCVETDKGQPGKPNISGREARAVRTHTAAGGTERWCCRRSPRVYVEEQLWHLSTCEGCTSAHRRAGEYRSNFHRRTIR